MQAITIEELKANSGLPGPRGNLELLHKFIEKCDQDIVEKCLEELGEDTANSPEEFVGMCGVVGYSMLNWRNTDELLGHLSRFAIHKSWRIREAVAIAVQEIPFQSLEDRVALTEQLETTDPLINRAIIAGLCEPRNLRKQKGIEKVFGHLWRATVLLAGKDRLSDGEDSLKKALGYCWSVAIVEAPELGKSEFERLFGEFDKNFVWIARENLKKKRLERIDKNWVGAKLGQLYS